jgi:hypothetical protein
MSNKLINEDNEEIKNDIHNKIEMKINSIYKTPTPITDIVPNKTQNITFAMDHNTTFVREVEEEEAEIFDEIIVWHPSGGLGHCLLNLSWVIQKITNNDNNIKLFIYGMNTHIPFGEYFKNILEIKKDILYEEIKDLDKFCNTYKLSNEDKKLIMMANFKTGLKKLTCTLDEKNNNYVKNIELICSTSKYNVKRHVKLKESYKNKILTNPFKYYENNYFLISKSINNKSTTNVTKSKYTFRIKGSYMRALGVMNKHLDIEKDDIKYSKPKKNLMLEYVDIHNNKHTKNMIELTTHEIPDIKRIMKASYGVLDKTVDVTERIKDYLLEEKKVELNAKIIEEQKKEIKHILQSEKYIAVHYRGRDKKADGGIEFKVKQIQRVIKKYKIYNVFVATDNYTFFDEICDKIKNINVFRYICPPKNGFQIHYNKKDFKKGENLYKAVLDMLICKKATHFIPSKNSGFSTMVHDLD